MCGTGGSNSRPIARFEELCRLAGIKSKSDIESGCAKPWALKHLRITCATYYDEHMSESSIDFLGHPVGGITYRHYAHRAPPLSCRWFVEPKASGPVVRGGLKKVPEAGRRTRRHGV